MEIFGINIEYDKWVHFIVIAMPSLWALIIAKGKQQIWLTFILCTFIAAGKELIYDLALKNGNPEMLDFLFSMIAPTIILIVTLKFKRDE